MNWLKKIMNKDIKTIKIDEKTVFNELKELEKQYIFKSHNIADEYYQEKGHYIYNGKDPLIELNNFIEKEIAIRDRLRELRNLDKKNKEND